MIVIGANVSSAGGVLAALPRAQTLGVEAIQFFVSSPRSWQRRVIPREVADEFRTGLEAGGFQLWIHGSYLMNFATANPVALAQAEQALAADLTDCAALGGKGVIFHLGSFRSAQAEAGTNHDRSSDQVIEQIVQTLTKVAETAPPEALIVVENSAGMGGSIGSTVEELGEIVRQLPEKRVKICLDTQHLFAAGYPVHKPAGLDAMIDDFDREIGRARLVVLHMNDSKIPLSGGVDRHENIGAGLIGETGVRIITHHPALQDLPFLLEVPGVDHTGPDKDNVDRLRHIALS